MPRSKRNKVVSLTKTKGKGRDLKSKLIESLRENVDEYENIFVVSFENLRASRFKDIRMDWRESRLYLGKNSVAQIALGKTPEDEFKDNLRHVSKRLDGNAGLLFTSRDKDEVMRYFDGAVFPEYAKAGSTAAEDVVIPPGPLPFGTSMIDQLRKLGMIVEVENGVLQLRESFRAAESGEHLTPEQAKVLVHFQRKLVDFKIDVTCCWSDGSFEEL